MYQAAEFYKRVERSFCDIHTILSQTYTLDPPSLYRLPKVRFECALHNIQVSSVFRKKMMLKEDYHDLAN